MADLVFSPTAVGVIIGFIFGTAEGQVLLATKQV
jgi:hypothetical protein